MKYLIIDGYNAISKIKIFDAKKDISLEASRLSFVKALVDFRQRNRLFDKIVIVFDGQGAGPGLGRESYGDVEVLFSNKDKDADKVIVDMLKVSPEKNRITVSSDDNFIKNHTRAFGCEIMTIQKLEDLISLKKMAAESKIIDKDLGKEGQDDITNELKKYWGVK
jgi:predicted RNA-binding protein with PIN domain